MPDTLDNQSPEAEQADPAPAVDPVAVRFAAMNLLARREHSLGELRVKLSRRFDDPDLINCELKRLVDENLQSDERYAESFVRQRSSRGYGPQRLRQEMREKDLSKEEVAAAFTAADINWPELAEQVLRKKFGTIDHRDLKQLARCQRFMHYRGFSRDHYQHLLEG